MAVSDEVRQVEHEIDDRVRALPLWRCAQERVVRAALDYYRDGIEMLMVTCTAALIERDHGAAHVPLLIEGRLRAGVFHVVKWALTLCPEQAVEDLGDEMIHFAQDLGANYEALVDSLKLAERSPG